MTSVTLDAPEDHRQRLDVLRQIRDHYMTRFRKHNEGYFVDPVTQLRVDRQGSKDPAEQRGSTARYNWYKSAYLLSVELVESEELGHSIAIALERYHAILTTRPAMNPLTIGSLVLYHDDMIAAYDVQVYSERPHPDCAYAKALRDWHQMAQTFLSYLNPAPKAT